MTHTPLIPAKAGTQESQKGLSGLGSTAAFLGHDLDPRFRGDERGENSALAIRA
jgi:hypothetical protein